MGKGDKEVALKRNYVYIGWDSRPRLLAMHQASMSPGNGLHMLSIPIDLLDETDTTKLSQDMNLDAKVPLPFGMYSK